MSRKSPLIKIDQFVFSDDTNSKQDNGAAGNFELQMHMASLQNAESLDTADKPVNKVWGDPHVDFEEPVSDGFDLIL